MLQLEQNRAFLYHQFVRKLASQQTTFFTKDYSTNTRVFLMPATSNNSFNSDLLPTLQSCRNPSLVRSNNHLLKFCCTSLCTWEGKNCDPLVKFCLITHVNNCHLISRENDRFRAKSMQTHKNIYLLNTRQLLH